ncbi:CHAT domain-containing protein [Streptomyces sp. RKAG293]|uniref:CHAT domain-containing protein n=1 Tax=Streptomyces sp. RKAG293 TaxID=2893403 RepID=UPI002033386F|nr:CHAT domain-containing protein [Streptomyces sp. RKAG293]MCM2422611.1 CHAT domain-containing protein [Streptomyces sp. RKAG293]
MSGEHVSAHDANIPPERIEEVLAADRRALLRAPAGGGRFTALGNMAMSHYARYQIRGSARDLDSAIDYTRRALAELPRTAGLQEQRWDVMENLGSLLSTRDTPADRREARRLFTECLRGRAAPGTEAHALLRGQLGLLAMSDLLADGDPAAADRCVDDLRYAVRFLPGERPEQLIYRANLATALLNRYQRAEGADDDLDASLELFDGIVAETSASSTVDLDGLVPGLVASLRVNLPALLHVRYMVQGRPADLERARSLAAGVPDSAAGVGAWQLQGEALNLEANIALAEYTRTGGISELERALVVQRRALESLRPGDHRLVDTLLNLSFLHHRRHGGLLRTDRVRARTDLAEALALARRAMDAPLTARELPLVRGMLGSVLLSCWLLGSVPEPAALDEAEALVRSTIEDPACDHRTRTSMQGTLADILTARAVRDGSTADLASALELLYGVREEKEGAAQAMATVGIAKLLLDRAEATTRPGHWAEARAEAADACRALAGRSAWNTFELARKWGNAEWRAAGRAVAGSGLVDLDHLDHAGVAFGLAVESLHQIAGAQLLREHKEHSARTAAGVSLRCAYAQAAGGSAEGLRRAVVTLETGRALMLSEMLERERGDLERLPGLGHGGLLAEYRSCARLLAALEGQILTGPPPAGPGLAGADPLPALDEARRALTRSVQQVQQVLGYEDFMRPPRFEALAAVARNAGEPLVYLAATDLGGMALLLRPEDPDRVVLVALPHFTSDFEEEVATAWRSATAEEADEDAAEEVCDALSLRLWTGVMGPVVKVLGGYAGAVLIPTGRLATVPLHAAGTSDPGAVTGRRHVIDHLAIRYAPTIRALGTAQQRLRWLPDRELRLLAVQEPSAAGLPALDAANDEVAAVCSWFPGRVSAMLDGGSATREQVLAALGDATVHHFACHAFFDPAHPLDGGLMMADEERITVRDLLASGRISSRLATLSACATGVVDGELPDEVVSLATAVLQAGAAGVLSSLWEVDSSATTALMTRFYEGWRRDRLPPSQALRRAQLWFRDSDNAAKHAALPTVEIFAPPADMSAETHAAWGAQREDSGPLSWSAFFHTGR